MYGFWLPKFLRRRVYQVLVRPTKQGEFLVFPFAWHRGGKGYALSLSLLKELNAPLLEPWDALPLALLGLSMPGAVLWWPLGLLVPLIIILWVRAFWRRYEARWQAILPRARFGGYLLTRSRFQLEFASLWQPREILIGLGLAGAGMFVFLAALWGFEGIVAKVLALMGLLAAGMLTKGMINLHRWARDAFRASVSPYDPVDVPLP
ncbi:MAG: hypothetical protein ACK5O1_04440 [Holosporales bacterium]|jgi:hypothetical protein